MALNYSDALKAAQEHEKTLSSYAFSGYEIVVIIHEEGSVLVFRSAFALEYGAYLLIFTEHHNYHVYHKNELTFFGHFKSQDLNKLTGTGNKEACSECKEVFLVDELRYGLHPDGYNYVALCKVCLDGADS
jgi:hypothetical protein